MLPLLLGAGRMLAAGAARGAVAGVARGAVAGGAREAVKKGVVEGAKKKAGSLAKSLIKKKTAKTKKVSPNKLLPKVNQKKSGGALVRRKSSAIIKRPTGNIVQKEEQKKTQEESKTFQGDELIKELTAIKDTLIKIKGVLGSNLANTLRDQRNQRTLLSKQKASEKEAEFEKKEPKKEGKKLKLPKKQGSFLDMIWNFISNVLLGSLLNFLWNYIPQIIKMFEDISKGLENPLQVLRLGIITISVLFRKQIKFLAKLTSKIIGPPAKLIGKLLLKAGGVAKKLFQKAGQIVFNLIKGPLTSLIKKIGGEALEEGVKGAARGAGRLAGRAAGAAGGAIGRGAQILSRLGVFRRILSKPPVIGAIIGFIIDLIMGEKPVRAAAGAIGAGLGAWAGGLLGGAVAGGVTLSTFGIGALAAPFIIGASGFIGSAIGDYFGKMLYDKVAPGASQVNKEAPAPVEPHASGGGIGGFFKSIFSGSISRNTATQAKAPVKTTKINAAVQEKARQDVLKDEESLRRFTTLSSIFAGTPFIGQLMKLGIDIGMGAKVQKTQTDLAAQDLGFTIGKALEDDEFSVPGLNKRLIGPLSKNLTEWAKTKIFNEVKAREGLFPSIKKSEEEKKDVRDRDARARGGYDPRYDEPPTTGGGLTVGRWGPLLDVIAAGEGGYESVNPSFTIPGLTKMTIAEADKKAQQMGQAKGGTGAMGRYQLLSDPVGRAKAAGLDPNKDLFSPANQDKIAVHIIENIRKGKEWIAGKLSDQEFLQGIANEWASMPNYYGKYSYSGQGGAIKADKLKKALAKVRSGGYSQAEIAKSTSKEQESSPKQAGKKIFLHWTAGGYNDNPSKFGYNAVFDGSGTKHQIRPYNVAGEHTWHRNTNSVGLSVAAMGGKTDPWSIPPKANQINAMTAEAANIAKSWGWKSSDINKNNVMTHAEIAKIDGYGPGSGDKQMRWDFLQTAKGKPDWSGGDELRQKIKGAMGGQGGDPGPGGGSNTNPLKLLASDAKTTYYDPSLGGINASGAKTKEGLPATSTGEGYRPNVFSAAAFPPMIAKLPSANLANAPGFPGGKTLKRPLNLVVTNSAGKQAVVRVNDVGPGVKGHSPNHMLDFSVAAKNFLGTGKGFKIEGPTSTKPGPLSGSATPASSGDSTETSAPDSSPAVVADKSLPTDELQAQKSDFENILRGDPGIESTIESIKQKPSYDQGGQKSIVMMPIPQSSSGSQVNPTGGISRSSPTISTGLNSKEVSSQSIRQVLASAFYKI